MVLRADVKFKGEVMIFSDQSEYDYPIKRTEIIVQIPGYNDPYKITINANQINVISAGKFDLGVFPDGQYTIILTGGDCELSMDVFNTYDLDQCINKHLLSLVSCASCKIDANKKGIYETAIIQRNAARLLDCNALDHYQVARKLVCRDCN